MGLSPQRAILWDYYYYNYYNMYNTHNNHVPWHCLPAMKSSWYIQSRTLPMLSLIIIKYYCFELLISRVIGEDFKALCFILFLYMLVMFQYV